MDHNFEKYVKPNMVALTDKNEIKILICYFINRLDKPITRKQLTEIATTDGIINYFLFVEAFDELVKSGLLILNEVDGAEYVELSELAASSAEEFKSIVPVTFRDKIMTAGLQFFAKLKAKDIKVEVRERDKGADVSFSCLDHGEELMSLSVYAPDKSQSELMKKKIEADPSGIYSKIIDMIIDN